jgi:hypothetical protein
MVGLSKETTFGRYFHDCFLDSCLFFSILVRRHFNGVFFFRDEGFMMGVVGVHVERKEILGSIRVLRA